MLWGNNSREEDKWPPCWAVACLVPVLPCKNKIHKSVTFLNERLHWMSVGIKIRRDCITIQMMITVMCNLFIMQVMLLANPSIEELYHKSCALAEDTQEVKDSFQHPARLIKVHHRLSMLVPCTWPDRHRWTDVDFYVCYFYPLAVDPQKYDYLNMLLTFLSFSVHSLFFSFQPPPPLSMLSFPISI